MTSAYPCVHSHRIVIKNTHFVILAVVLLTSSDGLYASCQFFQEIFDISASKLFYTIYVGIRHLLCVVVNLTDVVFCSPRSSVFCILLEPFSGLLNSSAGCRHLLYPNHPPTIEVAAPLGANMSSFFVLHPWCHLHSKTQLCCFPSDRLPAYAHCVIGQDDGSQYGEVPGPGSAEGCGPTAAARSGDHRLHFG